MWTLQSVQNSEQMILVQINLFFPVKARWEMHSEINCLFESVRGPKTFHQQMHRHRFFFVHHSFSFQVSKSSTCTHHLPCFLSLPLSHKIFKAKTKETCSAHLFETQLWEPSFYYFQAAVFPVRLSYETLSCPERKNCSARVSRTCITPVSCSGQDIKTTFNSSWVQPWCCLSKWRPMRQLHDHTSILPRWVSRLYCIVIRCCVAFNHITRHFFKML